MVFRDYQVSNKALQRDDYSYNFKALTSNCVLLPTNGRTHIIAGGGKPKKGRPGQANAFYVYEKGKRRTDQWIQDAIEYVRSYNGENLLINPGVEIEKAGIDTAEREYARSTGQAFNPSARVRRAIENYSMKKARQYFENELGYRFIKDSLRAIYSFFK